MSLEKARKYLDEKGFKDRIIIPEHSSATVAKAAEALGCEPGMIAKTLSFLVNDRAILILAEGMARIDNKKYKARTTAPSACQSPSWSSAAAIRNGRTSAKVQNNGKNGG